MRAPLLIAALLAASPLFAETLTVEPVAVTVWKPVYGQVETRDTSVARARLGGTLVELSVTEGDMVTAGQIIGLIHDDKIAFQIDAIDARLEALNAQLERAETEFARGQSLFERGTITSQLFDKLTTDVEVTRGEIAAVEAERRVLVQQRDEGAVLAPAAGRVLSVPVTRDTVILPGEPVATIGSGGFFLRIAVPERHSSALREGATIQIATGGAARTGTLAKVYPRIENGRVIADVEVDGLDTAFIDARILIEVPIGERQALLVPEAAVSTRSGIDFVTVDTEGGETSRAVVLGDRTGGPGAAMVEVLTGLKPGDKVVLP